MYSRNELDLFTAELKKFPLCIVRAHQRKHFQYLKLIVNIAIQGGPKKTRPLRLKADIFCLTLVLQWYFFAITQISADVLKI